jgi:Protein of unknown function (DUF1501)
MTSLFQSGRGCSQVSRRSFLSDLGLGVTGLVAGAMLAEDAGRLPAAETDFPPQADRVIWLFMIGGVSHLESFDPKPSLNRYAGKTFAETPYENVVKSPLISQNFHRFFGEAKHATRILPLQVGYRKSGQTGIEISDWWPNVAGCAEDLAIVRSLWTTDFNHSAQSLAHTGKMLIDGNNPSIGSWVHYGLGSLNETLPRFIVLGRQPSDLGGGLASHQSSYLGPEHDGVPIDVNARPNSGQALSEDANRPADREELEFIKRLDRLTSVEYPNDSALTARIKSYELAFDMQFSIPEVVNLAQETRETQILYGLDNPLTEPFGRQCLVARRLVEKGVRFVQLYHGGSADNDNGEWDSHNELRQGHSQRCAEVDRPIAGLLRDLKRRGLLKRTLVVFMTEFGRAPNVDLRTDGPADPAKRCGRDHHIYGFSAWMAGGGVKQGVVCGATDELGFHAVEDRHYITDIHATVLHQLGIDCKKLQFPGRRRLNMEIGEPIRRIIA